MAKHDLEHLAATYAVAERFVDRALRQDDSLFTPAAPCGRSRTSRSWIDPMSKHLIRARVLSSRSCVFTLLRGTGAFVMRFYVGNTEIAEGTFNLTR